MSGIKIKVDTKEFKKLKEAIGNLTGNQRIQFNEEAVKELAARLLAKVVKLTPVGKKPDGIRETVKVKGTNGKSKSFLTTRAVALQSIWSGYQGGTLNKGWTVGNVAKSGGEYKIEVINPVEYAWYVEHGHRGVFIPELGVTLHKNTHWTKGKFMLTISEKELEADAPRILQNKLDKFISEVFKSI